MEFDNILYTVSYVDNDTVDLVVSCKDNSCSGKVNCDDFEYVLEKLNLGEKNINVIYDESIKEFEESTNFDDSNSRFKIKKIIFKGFPVLCKYCFEDFKFLEEVIWEKLSDDKFDISSLFSDKDRYIIPSSCFSGCSSLKKIKVPFLMIATCAFYECSKLQSFDYAYLGTYSKRRTFVASNAFLECDLNSFSIRLIDDSTSQKYILGDFSLKDNKNLTNIEGLDNLNEIAESMLEGCENLILDKLPNSINSIKKKGLYGCRFGSGFDLPDKLEVIENNAIDDLGRYNKDEYISITVPATLNNFSERSILISNIGEIKFDGEYKKNITKMFDISLLCKFNKEKGRKLRIVCSDTKAIVNILSEIAINNIDVDSSCIDFILLKDNNEYSIPFTINDFKFNGIGEASKLASEDLIDGKILSVGEAIRNYNIDRYLKKHGYEVMYGICYDKEVHNIAYIDDDHILVMPPIDGKYLIDYSTLEKNDMITGDNLVKSRRRAIK